MPRHDTTTTGTPWSPPCPAQVQRHDLFVDRLVAADAKRMANSDDNYFLFEDVVKATLLLMARDTRLAPGPTHPPAGGTLSVGGWACVCVGVHVYVWESVLRICVDRVSVCVCGRV